MASKNSNQTRSLKTKKRWESLIPSDIVYVNNEPQIIRRIRKWKSETSSNKTYISLINICFDRMEFNVYYPDMSNDLIIVGRYKNLPTYILSLERLPMNHPQISSIFNNDTKMEVNYQIRKLQDELNMLNSVKNCICKMCNEH